MSSDYIIKNNFNIIFHIISDNTFSSEGKNTYIINNSITNNVAELLYHFFFSIDKAFGYIIKFSNMHLT